MGTRYLGTHPWASSQTAPSRKSGRINQNEFLIDLSTLYPGATLFRHLKEEPNSIFLRSISEIRNIQCQTNLSNYLVRSKPLILVVPQVIGVFARRRHYGRLLGVPVKH
jgi:hypothetical protein